jgi:hypothetical protein
MTLIIERASASRPSGEWNDDDYDVLADGTVVGRIMKVPAAPVGSPWMWTLAFGQHEDRTRQHTATRSRHSTIAGGASAASAIMNASIASRWHRARTTGGNGRNSATFVSVTWAVTSGPGLPQLAARTARCSRAARARRRHRSSPTVCLWA